MQTLRKLRPLAIGLATYVLPESRFGHGGVETAEADYCYSVLMRHAARLQEQGLNPFQGTIAELGPGAGLGVGIGALMLGAENYIGLDLIDYDCWKSNAAIFDKLLPYIREQREIPNGGAFINVKPELQNHAFPSGLFTDADFARLMDDARIAKLREEVSAPGGRIRYAAPWMEDKDIKPEGIHWIYSQAVLEHVDDLENTYRLSAEWLEPGGFISHQIDFKSHGFAPEWNGHWKYPEPVWKLVRGKRKYAINRAPASTHINLIEKYGLEIVYAQPVPMTNSDGGVPPQKLAQPFKSMNDNDQMTSGLFVIARKPA